MYLAHFGLRERPFSNTPDARFVYLGTRHEKAIAHLLGGVQAPGGFVHLTGEAGNGKTTVCRLLLNRLSPGVDVALILNPVLTPGELLAAVCDELGVKHEGQESSWTKLVEALYRHLLVTHGGGRRTVVIVDEAQNLGVGAFEQVRLLTKLEADGQKLLQVILIGQPELIEMLGRTELHQLPEAISSGYHLLPFEEAQTYAYVRHRRGPPRGGGLGRGRGGRRCRQSRRRRWGGGSACSPPGGGGVRRGWRSAGRGRGGRPRGGPRRLRQARRRRRRPGRGIRPPPSSP